jgi:hypothetical protein
MARMMNVDDPFNFPCPKKRESMNLNKVSHFLRTAGVTGQQRMLTPPRHLILPSHLSEVRVALHSIL